MTTSESLTADITNTLDLIAESFVLYPIPGVKIPTEDEYHTFLVQYPNYVSSKQGAIALRAADNRNYTEGLTLAHEKLSGSLIGVLFTQDQLLEIANS